MDKEGIPGGHVACRRSLIEIRFCITGVAETYVRLGHKLRVVWAPLVRPSASENPVWCDIDLRERNAPLYIPVFGGSCTFMVPKRDESNDPWCRGAGEFQRQCCKLFLHQHRVTTW